MVKDFQVRYDGHDAVLKVGDSVACKTDDNKQHSFFDVPLEDVCLALLADKKSVRLNWFVQNGVETTLFKSNYAARIIEEIRTGGAELHG